MRNSQYQELDRLIREYEEDYHTIKADRLVMKNYPKVLTLSAASLFERRIKKRCNEFLLSPNLPLDASYPKIFALTGSGKPAADKMFAKLEGYEDAGIEHLNAQKFYDLFGGQAFSNTVKSKFAREQTDMLLDISEEIAGLSALIGKGEQYDYAYAKQCDLRDQIEICSFEDAEKSYLNMKLRRNRIAHDYIDGLSDTFEDIQKFYYVAVIYVVALEESIGSLTTPDT